MIMEKKNLSFEDAFKIFADLNPACYSHVGTHQTVIEIPVLTSYRISFLVDYVDWYVAASDNCFVKILLLNS